MKNILILIIAISVIFIAVDFARTEKECPKNKVIYRYIPRTLEEELESPAFVSDIFKTMFTQPSPWIDNVDSSLIKRREDINQYFISQF
jgi:hypothetical protein